MRTRSLRDPSEQCEALLWGRAGLQDVDPVLADFYTLGHLDGRDSLARELAQAEAEADRYYRLAFNPRLISVPTVSFAELSARRGEYAKASEARASLARRLGPSKQAS